MLHLSAVISGKANLKLTAFAAIKGRLCSKVLLSVVLILMEHRVTHFLSLYVVVYRTTCDHYSFEHNHVRTLFLLVVA